MKRKHQQSPIIHNHNRNSEGIGNNIHSKMEMMNSTGSIGNITGDGITGSSSSNTSSYSNSTEAPQLQVLPETTAYWSREPYAWSSTSMQQPDNTDDGTTTTTTTHHSTKHRLPPPLLTSSKCSKAFYDVFRNTYYSDIGNIDPAQPNFLLSILVESCSHPSGLNALYAQPYMYAGPGLGNMDSCPLQTCIAGNGDHHDSITFASICVVPECTAYDLGSEDFIASIARQYDYAMQDTTPLETIDLGREYVLLLRRIAEINKFLKTGWTCGDFIVPFDMFPFGLPYLFLCCTFVLLSLIGTIKGRRKPRKCRTTNSVHQRPLSPSPNNESTVTSVDPSTIHHNGVVDCNNNNDTTTLLPKLYPTTECTVDVHDSAWSAFDIGHHLSRLTQPPSPSTEPTACIDGIRVGSTLWIILGHVLAIQSSSGAGYSNPSNFLPPTGLTTTLIGQLLFSSRLAVDTFLSISGYLVVHGLCRFQQPNYRRSSWWRNVVVRYLTTIPTLLLSRFGRILPLYAMSLGFFTQIAPQMGNGPFWHQWIDLLQPCHDFIWTNFLFINNFIPLQTPTTNTCFYHSWYLAVDMQLFVLAPFLVYWYYYRKWQGQVATIILFLMSVMMTAHYSYVRGWSINTFDGSLVNRYDVEAYANPIVRAQAYLAGMYVAFLIHNRNAHSQLCDLTRMVYRWTHRAIMTVALTIMLVVTFITVTGAYARRPCTFDEDPFSYTCGSTWSQNGTFLYTAFGRTAWIIGLSVMLYLCIGQGRSNHGDGNLVACVLSWSCWKPLSQLSFGAYLIHPIVVFVWQLGDREKQVFRLLTFGMDYISVCVVSFVAALFASVLVEFPCAFLLKKVLELPKWSDDQLAISTSGKCDDEDEFRSTDSTPTPTSISPLTPSYENYGSLVPTSKA